MTERSIERLEATVHGLVQGVGYRWFTVHRATRLGLTGWAANESDGSVRILAEGDSGALDTFLDNLREGPAGAQVVNVDHRRLPATGGFSSFGIRSGGHRGD